MVKLKIVWDEFARTSMREAYHFIRKDSLQQAEKVIQEILTATGKLADNPQMYPPDRYRTDKGFTVSCF